jgi:hypothetical protein
MSKISDPSVMLTASVTTTVIMRQSGDGKDKRVEICTHQPDERVRAYYRVLEGEQVRYSGPWAGEAQTVYDSL